MFSMSTETSRSAIPSQKQQEMLLDCLEETRWLVNGYARTSHARERTKAAWQDIARKLSCDASGCIKSWQQWAKYWKDKKSAVKRKCSLMHMSRQSSDGCPTENETMLSKIEERIVTLLGEDSFANGDRELEINPFLKVELEHDSSPSHNQQTNQPVIKNETHDDASERLFQYVEIPARTAPPSSAVGNNNAAPQNSRPQNASSSTACN